jgi:type VI secretion system protein ImpK
MTVRNIMSLTLEKAVIIDDNTKTHRKKKSALLDFINANFDSRLAEMPKIRFHKPKVGINPMVDSAARIFSMALHCQQLPKTHQLKDWVHQFVVAVNEFCQVIKGFDYSNQAIMSGRYAICAFIDDVLKHSPMGLSGQWDPKYCLLDSVRPSGETQDRLYRILERAMREPELYVDGLELFYLVLSGGYKGQYRGTSLGFQKRHLLIDDLYQVIRQTRGEVEKRLSEQWARPLLKRESWFTRLPLRYFIGGGLLAISLLGIGFHYVDALMTQHMLASLQSIGKIVA